MWKVTLYVTVLLQHLVLLLICATSAKQWGTFFASLANIVCSNCVCGIATNHKWTRSRNGSKHDPGRRRQRAVKAQGSYFWTKNDEVKAERSYGQRTDSSECLYCIWYSYCFFGGCCYELSLHYFVLSAVYLLLS